MAKRATLSTVPSYLPGTTSASAINASDDALNIAFDNTLSRDGSTPNTMLVDFDMNNKDILNVKNIFATDITIGGVSIAVEVTAAAASAAAAASSKTDAASSATNAATSETNAAASAVDAAAALDTKVSKDGDTMTGLLLLSGDAAVALGAATKQQMDTADALKAPLASPALTGNPTAPTPSGGDNDTSVATTAFVTGEISAGGFATLTGAEELTNKTLTDPIFSGIATLFQSTGIDDDAPFPVFKIDSSRRILIGANVPDLVGAVAGAMTISTGNSGVTGPDGRSDDLLIETNTHGGISIMTPNASQGIIAFGDPENVKIGKIVYDHDVNTLVFTSADGARLQLDANTGTTAGTASAGSGNQTVELMIGGLRYNLLHDGTT